MALTSDLNDVRPSDDVRPDKCLASILTFPSDRGLGCHRAELSQWESIKDHLPDASALASETSTPWRTFILNGIHRRMAAVLAQGLDMDPSFFDSHILRSRYYVPPSLRDIRCFQLDFPELKAISPSSIYSLHPMTMQLILNPLSLRSQFLHSMPPDRAFILDSAFDRFGSRHRWYAYFRRVSCWVNDKRRICKTTYCVSLHSRIAKQTNWFGMTSRRHFRSQHGPFSSWGDVCCQHSQFAIRRDS